MRIFSLLLISCVLFGCRKTDDGYRIYTIKEGKHRSTIGLRSQTSDNLLFECKFDESAVYESKDPVNQYDINKLYGFSDCNSHHQKNSARFGWRYVNGEIEIHAYVYNDGVRVSKYITSVQPNERHLYHLLIEKDSYRFSVDMTSIHMPRTNKCEKGLYYKLFPYFGGDESAPHDIKILIKEL